MTYHYDWIDAVTLGCWFKGSLVARVAVFEDDPYFCSVDVFAPLTGVARYRDVDVGEDSDPDSPWFMGNAVDLACDWIEAIVEGRPLPAGGEC